MSAATSPNEHGHSHGLIDDTIKRSREGLRAVGLSLAVLALAAGAQLAIFVATGSVALLADLIHNFGDAATAIPLAIAFLLRSERAERIAGLFVIAAIFISACVAGVEAVARLINPEAPTHLLPLAVAGVIGYLANLIAARIRTRAGHRLDSPGTDRGWQPRPGRCLRQSRCNRRRRRGRPRARDRRSTDRSRDNRRHPQNHLGLVAHRAWP